MLSHITNEWTIGQYYEVNSVIEFHGKHFKALRAHTSEKSLEPDQIASLWQETTVPIGSVQRNINISSISSSIFSSLPLVQGGVKVDGIIYGEQSVSTMEYIPEYISSSELEWKDTARSRTLDYYHKIDLKIPVAPLAWVLTSGDKIPKNAIQCGMEKHGERLFSSRAYFRNGVHCGKVSALSIKGCKISFGSNEYDVFEYEILVGLPQFVKWVNVHGELVLSGGLYLGSKLILAGNDGEQLYIAQTMVDGSIQVGKAGPGKRKACVPYAGNEKNVQDYRVLAYV